MKHVYITKSCNYNENNFYERSQPKFACMHVKIRNLLKGFKLNIILGSFTNIYTHIPILVKIGQQQWEFYMKTYKRLCAEWSGEESHLKFTWDSPELLQESLVGLATTPGNSPWWRQQSDAGVINPRYLWRHWRHLWMSTVKLCKRAKLLRYAHIF
jgi:hypothetical protein